MNGKNPFPSCDVRICLIIDEFKGAGALKHWKHFLCCAFRVHALFRQHLNLDRHETSKAAQALGLAREDWQPPPPPPPIRAGSLIKLSHLSWPYCQLSQRLAFMKPLAAHIKFIGSLRP